MRTTKKIFSTFICCKMKKSSCIIFVVVLTFITGNIYLLLPFMNKQNTSKTSKGSAYSPPEIQKKENFKDDFLQKKFEKYLNNGQETVEKLSNIKEEKKQSLINFDQRTVALASKAGAKTNKQVKQNESKMFGSKKIIDMAILVISCNRPSVGRCLDRIFKYKPEDIEIPVIVSQDCGHEPTAKVIRSYGNNLTHIEQPDLGDVSNVPANMGRYMGYYKISRHFKFALTKVFSEWPVSSIVIVEDDIDIAPDFFDYFLATRALLEVDKSLYCVSAWNDNGKTDSIDRKAIDLLHRSDFFPGLGWLITRDLWRELSPKWPLGFWDDWMRAPEQRRNRACIRPEISRTKTFGRVGVSQGQFYDQYLKYIVLNEQPYPFRDIDLSYLRRSKYDNNFIDTIYAAPERSADTVNEPNNNGSEELIRITYHSNYEIEMLAKKFGLMSDLKAGVPRTAYKGVVTFYRNGRRIYLAPPRQWNGYSES